MERVWWELEKRVEMLQPIGKSDWLGLEVREMGVGVFEGVGLGGTSGTCSGLPMRGLVGKGRR